MGAESSRQVEFKGRADFLFVARGISKSKDFLVERHSLDDV